MSFSDDELLAGKLVQMSNQVTGGKNIYEGNIIEWFGCDIDYKM